MRTLQIHCIVFFVVTALSAQPYLTGDLSGDLAPGVYRVTGTLTVPTRHTLRIPAGTSLYFDQFSGMRVEGTLVADGTRKDPVVLTSYKLLDPDSARFADSFDWNGLEVTPDADAVLLRNTELSHSTLGLRFASRTTSVVLDTVMFESNGMGHCNRAGALMMIADKIPVKMKCGIGDSACVVKELAEMLFADNDAARPEAVKKTQQKGPTKPKKERKPLDRRTLFFRLGSGAITAGGAAMWIAGHYFADKHDAVYQEQSTTAGADAEREARDAAVVIRNTGIILTMLGPAGFTVTLFF